MMKYISGQEDDPHINCDICKKIINPIEDCWDKSPGFHFFICLKCAPIKKEAETLYSIFCFL